MKKRKGRRLSPALREMILDNLQMGDCWGRYEFFTEECHRCMAAKECAVSCGQAHIDTGRETGRRVKHVSLLEPSTTEEFVAAINEIGSEPIDQAIQEIGA